MCPVRTVILCTRTAGSRWTISSLEDFASTSTGHDTYQVGRNEHNAICRPCRSFNSVNESDLAAFGCNPASCRQLLWRSKRPNDRVRKAPPISASP